MAPAINNASCLRFRPFSRSDALAMMSWRYPAPYSAYNLDSQEPTVLAELLRTQNRYHAILCDGEMIGFFCVGRMLAFRGGTTTTKLSMWAWVFAPTAQVKGKDMFALPPYSPSSVTRVRAGFCAPPCWHGISGRFGCVSAQGSVPWQPSKRRTRATTTV